MSTTEAPECEEQLLTLFIYRIAGKFGALFASIPFTIFAAVYCVLFGLVGWSSCFPEPVSESDASNVCSLLAALW